MPHQYTQTPPMSRFWAKVEKTDSCWLWTAATNTDGYGRFYTGPTGIKMMQAHRFSWELLHGTIPVGMCVLHSCDNPTCVRPEHLFLGTRADNNADKAMKGRAMRGEQHRNTRLTDDDVRCIRTLSAQGQSTRSIARRFGMTPMSVRWIIQRKTWKHVE